MLRIVLKRLMGNSRGYRTLMAVLAMVVPVALHGCQHSVPVVVDGVGGHEAVWRNARQAHEPQACARFRDLFPHSPYAEAAYQCERTLLWRRAEAAADPGQYRRFIARFPDDPLAEEAKNRMAALDFFYRLGYGDRWRGSVAYTDRGDASMVEIDVNTFDEQGRPVVGLSRDDLDVYEDGQRVEIVDFQGMETPRRIDIILVVDTSQSMQSTIEQIKRSILVFARTMMLRQCDVAFGLIVYGEDVQGVLGGYELLHEPAELVRWVDGIRLRGAGLENPLRALQEATEMPFRENARRLVLLITDEQPNFDRDPITGLDSVGVGRLLRDQQIALYAIAPSQSDWGLRGEGDYERMFHHVEGRLFNIDTVRHDGKDGFEYLMREIAELLSSQYRITYRPPDLPVGNKSGEVRVKIRQPGIWLASGRVKGGIVRTFVGQQAECQMLVVTRRNGAYTSSDCGQLWRHMHLPVHGEIKQASGHWGAGHEVLLLDSDGNLFALAPGQEAEPRGAALDGIERLAWSDGSRTLWAMKEGRIYYSDDAGRTFVETSLSFDPQVRTVFAADPYGELRLCTIDEGNSFACSESGPSGSGNQRWDRVGSIPIPSSVRNGPLELFFSPYTRGLIFIVDSRGGMVRTEDGGRTWKEMPPMTASRHGGASRPGSIMFERGGVIRYAMGDTLAMSSDGGRTWREESTAVGIRNGLSSLQLSQVGGEGRQFAIDAENGQILQHFAIEGREYFPEHAAFEGRDQPTERMREFLESIASKVQQTPGLSVLIEGSFGNSYQIGSSYQSSSPRVTAVRETLGAHGVAPQQMLVRTIAGPASPGPVAQGMGHGGSSIRVVFLNNRPSNRRARQPRVRHGRTPRGNASHPSTAEVIEKLRALQRWRGKGLVSEEEYRIRYRRLIDQL